MGDIQNPQARYSPLHNNSRKGIFEKNKWILFTFTTCLMVFVTLWLIFVHVNQEGLLYPQDKSYKKIPYHWVHRAIIYNTYNASKITFTENVTSSQNEVNDIEKFKMVCYYNFPSEAYGLKRLIVKNIDAKLCTHINIAFGSVVNNSVYLNRDQIKVSQEIVNLKKRNVDLKVMLSIGGAGSTNGFPLMVIDHENRKTFIKSIINLIREYKFDGIDLDWEFPEENVRPDGKQRMHFTQLLHEIRNEINRQENYKFLLSIAVAAPIFLVDNAYDISYINEYVDFINLMSYDYHFYTRLTPFTGINSPLYSPDSDIGYFATLNINYSSNYWLYKGMDRHKIIIGLPTYGHTFRLVNSLNNGINAPSNAYGSLGTNGFVGYNELCLFLSRNKIRPTFDMVTKSPYATRSNEWISFDDVQSLTFKAEFIRNNNFGGAMIYALNTDDHSGICNNDLHNQRKIRFPLTRKIKETLENKEL